MKDKQKTKDRLKGAGVCYDDICLFCRKETESCSHLFFSDVMRVVLSVRV